MPTDDFDRNVFVNCPFDKEYDPILQAVLFCLVRFGLNPRIATERSDSGESRIDKIYELISSSRFSIHDLSRCQTRNEDKFYRLNMPFELGVDFGSRRFGSGRLRSKVSLVLEEQQYSYQAAISDLAGADIEAHDGRYEIAVRKVRNWLASSMPDLETLGADRVLAHYEDFQEWYVARKRDLGFSEDDIRDYSTAELLSGMSEWHQLHPISH